MRTAGPIYLPLRSLAACQVFLCFVLPETWSVQADRDAELQNTVKDPLLGHIRSVCLCHRLLSWFHFISDVSVCPKSGQNCSFSGRIASDLHICETERQKRRFDAAASPSNIGQNPVHGQKMAKSLVDLWFCTESKPENPAQAADPEPGFPKEFWAVYRLFLDKEPDIVFNDQGRARGSTNILPIRN